MLVKFFSNGQGGGAPPVNYLIAREVLAYDEYRNVIRNEDGTPQMKQRDPLPEIISGNPDLTRMLIDSSNNKWSYRAGVIAFAVEDAPTDEQQRDAIAQFEALAFAGLDAEQFNILWVRHTHESNVELHFCIPRLELTTGKSFNPAPPGYERAFNAYRDLMNKKYGWADPEDPSRASERKFISEKPDRIETREEIQTWIEDLIVSDAITDRAEMIKALTETGFQVPRAGKSYLTIQLPEPEIRFRMKGEIYHADWTKEISLERAIASENEGAARNAKTISRLEGIGLQDLRRKHQENCDRRKKYNRRRYFRRSERTALAIGGRVFETGGDFEKTGRETGSLQISAERDLRPSLELQIHRRSFGGAELTGPLDDDAKSTRAENDPDRFGTKQIPLDDQSNKRKGSILRIEEEGRKPKLRQTESLEVDHEENRSISATIAISARDRVAFIRRRIRNNRNQLHQAREQMEPRIRRLTAETARYIEDLALRIRQMSDSLQRGLDWLGQYSNQSRSSSPDQQGPHKNARNLSGRFVAKIRQIRNQQRQRER
jgi:3-methyladenine DNA glycosylase AlkC